MGGGGGGGEEVGRQSKTRTHTSESGGKKQDLPSKTFTLGGYFRDAAESTLKIYPSMESKTYTFPNQNACFRPDRAASRKKSRRFRGEV